MLRAYNVNVLILQVDITFCVHHWLMIELRPSHPTDLHKHSQRVRKPPPLRPRPPRVGVWRAHLQYIVVSCAVSYGDLYLFVVGVSSDPEPLGSLGLVSIRELLGQLLSQGGRHT